MNNFTIDEFWKQRLSDTRQVGEATSVKGWDFSCDGLSSFTEAPLTQNTKEYGSDVDPFHSPILLVSAPGAVGKSTLAKQIAAQTGAVYVDLAQADPVGAFTLTGSLDAANILTHWREGSATTLIDGLDEARLRVTQEAFQSFLADVARLSSGRNCPTVLFGRTKIVEDAWLMLHEASMSDIAVLEIGYYDPDSSVAFAEACLAASTPDRPHASVQREALQLLLNALRNQTETDGDRFAGYAPVLQAVAKRVGSEGNPASLVANLQSGAQLVTLGTVVTDILEREQSKLSSLPFKDPNKANSLYNPIEQLARLAARIYKAPTPEVPNMLPEDADIYMNALETWVAEHPFLDGGTGTSSAVFEAMISAYALLSTESSEVALKKEINRGTAANPFLHTFYMDEISQSASGELKGSHIGVIYASLRASLSIGETASLYIEGYEEADDSLEPAEGEFVISRHSEEKPVKFTTDQLSPIVLGPYINDAKIMMPHTTIEVGPGSEVTLVAPVSLQCKELLISCEKLIVDCKGLVGPEQDDTVWLFASDLLVSSMTSLPVVRNNARLHAYWPDVRNYPWTSFASTPSSDDDPRITDALRRLRRFVVEFRSSGNNQLARSKDKIDSDRMTKDVGRVVLERMVLEGILLRENWGYVLDTDMLAQLIGVTYGDCMAYRFGDKAIAFANRALSSGTESATGH